MAKKIITENTNLTREELEILAKVPNDVFFFSLFCYVIHPVRTISLPEIGTIPVRKREIQHFAKVSSGWYYRTYFYVLPLVSDVPSE